MALGADEGGGDHQCVDDGFGRAQQEPPESPMKEEPAAAERTPEKMGTEIGSAVELVAGTALRLPAFSMSLKRVNQKTGGGSRTNLAGSEGSGMAGSGCAGRRNRRASLLSGFHMLLVGFPNPSESKVYSLITEMGGTIVGPSEYEFCTHICLRDDLRIHKNGSPILNLAGKTVVSEQWVRTCYEDGVVIVSNANSVEDRNMVVSTSKKPRLIRSSSSTSKAKRKLLFMDVDEEEIRRKHHDLFCCEKDAQEHLTLAAYARRNKKKLCVTYFIPGSLYNDTYTVTADEVKVIIKDAYMLFKHLHDAGLTLNGNFTSKNLLVATRFYLKYVLFGELEKGSLQKLSSSLMEAADVRQFKLMIREEVFGELLPPHDITVWLSMIEDKQLSGVLFDHLHLLRDKDASERFLHLIDKFKILEKDKNKVCQRIVDKLKAYRGWRQVIGSDDGNKHLKTTMSFADDPANNVVPYEDDAGGLLKLLRNSRHHDALPYFENFMAIVTEHHPNLVSDFQIAMREEGYRA